MSSYIALAFGIICLFGGIVWHSDTLCVMSSVFICTSVIISRLDNVIVLLRMKR